MIETTAVEVQDTTLCTVANVVGNLPKSIASSTARKAAIARASSSYDASPKVGPSDLAEKEKKHSANTRGQRRLLYSLFRKLLVKTSVFQS